MVSYEPYHEIRVDPRLAPSQWETSLQSNAVSHWLGANLESSLWNCHEEWHLQLLTILKYVKNKCGWCWYDLWYITLFSVNIFFFSSLLCAWSGLVPGSLAKLGVTWHRCHMAWLVPALCVRHGKLPRLGQKKIILTYHFALLTARGQFQYQDHLFYK